MGAGFSKAVSGAMPINDQLGERAVDVAGINDAPTFSGGRFETWLSRLAEPQPDLTPAENAFNYARFLQVADAIHKVITEAESDATSSGLPCWLHRFVTAAHFDQTAIITFNYDTIVERAIEAQKLGTTFAGHALFENTLSWVHAYDGVPRSAGPFATDETPTLRLLKLHGSVHWHWVTGDTTGVSLRFGRIDGSDEQRRRDHPGRQPFIVPPAALKSSYFRNPIVAQIWSDAARSIRRADHIALIGYSLPVTDLVAAGMIGDAIDGNSVVIMANPDPGGEVSASISRAIGRAPRTIRGTVEYIEEFVADRARQVVADLLAASDRVDRGALVRVGWNSRTMAAAMQPEIAGDVIRVRVGRFPSPDRPVSEGSDRQAAWQARRLIDMCRPGMRIEALFENGQRSPIVGIEQHQTLTGQSTLWQVLVPADHPDTATA